MLLDPDRTLVSALAQRLQARTVGSPYTNGLAGRLRSQTLALWMLDGDGMAWQVLLHGDQSVQEDWMRTADLLRRGRRAPWRWLLPRQPREALLATLRSATLDSVTPQGPEGPLPAVVEERIAQGEAWADEDVTHLLALWTCARLIEGHTPESARTMLALQLAPGALRHPAVAAWLAYADDTAFCLA